MDARESVVNEKAYKEDGVERELRDLDRQLVEAVVRSNATALHRLIAEDYTFTDPFGEVTNKSKVVESMIRIE